MVQRDELPLGGSPQASLHLAGAAIDYPHPFFPYLAMILVTANVLGCLAARIKRCSWMRWIILIVTLGMLHLWALRLGTALHRQQSPAPELAPTWFIPALVALAAAYLAIAIFGILRSGTKRIARFDFSLPTINVVWSFAAAYYVVGAGMGSNSVLGIICVVAAALHIGLGAWLASRHLERAPGTNSFVVAGTVLLGMALPVTFGTALPALPILSGMAYGLCYVANRWQSGGVRLSSYILQAYAAYYKQFKKTYHVQLQVESIVLKGKGLPNVRGYGRGDLVARIFVEVPAHLTAKQRELLEQYARTENGAGSPLVQGFWDKVKTLFG